MNKKFIISLLGLSLVLLFLVSRSLIGQDKKKVIIDVDMGQLNDDAVTMFMLLQSGKVDLMGVTTVSGNTWVEAGTAYTLRQLELINRADISVYKGAGIPLMGNRQSWLSNEFGLWGGVEYTGAWHSDRPSTYLELQSEPYRGYPTTKPEKEHAVDFIVRTIKENPNEVTLFVLGPVTNIALAIRKNPEIIPLVKEVYYMGGAFDVPGNTTPAAEFNWWFDPEAAKISVRAPFRSQLIVPNDIAESVYYTKEHYDRIINGPSNSSIVRMFKEIDGPRFQSNPQRRSFVWDALTAAIFLRPELITKMEDRYVDVDDYYGPNYGRSIGYDENHFGDLDSAKGFPVGTQKASILLDIDQEGFWDYYIDLMTRPVVGKVD